MGIDDRYNQLIGRRIARVDIVVGRAYVIHARNGGVGVAVMERGDLGYRLHREKFGQHYLFVEFDWDNGPPYGTAIPLATVDIDPPEGESALLAWLRDREEDHRAEIDAAWETILGFPPSQLRPLGRVREK